MMNQDLNISTNSIPSDVAGCCLKHDLQLPVAPRTNARIRFIPTELKATGKTMHPGEAARWLQRHMEDGHPLETVGIVGPGDPLASPDQMFQTLRLIRDYYPDLSVYIRTIGIGGEKYADKLHQYGVNCVELLIDGLESAILEKLYAWIRPGFKTLPLPKAVGLLQQEQERAIQAFKEAGMHVTAVTTLYPDHNVDHIEKMAKVLAKKGVDEMVLLPFVSNKSSDIIMESMGAEEYGQCVEKVAKHIAIKNNEDGFASFYETYNEQPSSNRPTKERPNVAVVSSNGIEIDQHLGHANQILVYGPREDGLVCLLEARSAPESGGGVNRWLEVSDLLDDCFVLLAASAGEKPKAILAENNLPLVLTNDEIDGTIEVLYGLNKKKGKKT